MTPRGVCIAPVMRPDPQGRLLWSSPQSSFVKDSLSVVGGYFFIVMLPHPAAVRSLSSLILVMVRRIVLSSVPISSIMASLICLLLYSPLLLGISSSLHNTRLNLSRVMFVVFVVGLRMLLV